MNNLIAQPEKVWHHERVKFNSVISYETAYEWWCLTYQRSPEDPKDENGYWLLCDFEKNLELEPINPPTNLASSSDEWEFIYTGTTIKK